MPGATSRRIDRLTVAAGMSPGASEAMAIAVRLAARLGARLEALFVQEDSLVRLAELPLARRLRFPSGDAEPIDPAALRAEFAAQERRLRAAIASTAGESGVEWRFQRVPDHPPCENCELLVMAASTIELRSGSVFAALAHGASGVLILPQRRIARHRTVAFRPPAARASPTDAPAALVDVVRAVLAEWGLEARGPDAETPSATSPGTDTGDDATPSAQEPGISLPGIGTLSLRALSELLDRLGSPLLLMP